MSSDAFQILTVLYAAQASLFGSIGLKHVINSEKFASR